VEIRDGLVALDIKSSKTRPRDLGPRETASAPGVRALTSSTRLFHDPHAEHWPDHLEWTAPQDWHA
jgi:hypothetical protein